MANQKGKAVQLTIQTLHDQGKSIRAIARELRISRNTVRRYVRELQTDPPAPKVLTGVEDQTDPPGEKVLTGSDPLKPEGFERSQSKCLAHHAFIKDALEQGLDAHRIYQDLTCDHGFAGSYSSVQRFVKNMRSRAPVPFRRMECLPGEEAQIDFGQGTWTIDNEGKRRRPWLFRIVLSHSRKGYSEVVYQQSTEAFVRAMENAFRHFGGVPKTLVPDNLKAAVKKADRYDPELQPKIQSFCRHYGTTMMPTKVRTPEHKGKVERGIDYAQNALKGRTFNSLQEQNNFLRHWEANIADLRIHGTTKRQVRRAFEAEQEHLLPLPDTLFPCFKEAMRKGHIDGHVEVAKAYYSIPPEFTQRQVLVRWDNNLVRILNPHTLQQVRVHARTEDGHFHTDKRDIPAKKISSLERGEHYLMDHVRLLGADAHQWATQMLQVRGLPGLRVLQGLLSLGRKHPREVIANACSQASQHSAYNLPELRVFAARCAAAQPELPLQQNHPLIRPLDAYSISVLNQQGDQQ